MQLPCADEAAFRRCGQGDGEILQNFRLEGRGAAFGLAYAIFLRRRLKLGKRCNAQLLMDLQYLIRTKARHGESSSTLAGTSFQSSPGSGATRLMQRDDIGNGIANTRDFGKRARRNNALKRLRKRHQVVCRAKIRLCTIRISAAKGGSIAHISP